MNLHDLRRSAVKNLRDAGVSEHVAMKITGHKTTSVFRRYHIVTTDDVSDAMSKVETASLHGDRKPVQSMRSMKKELKARQICVALSSNG